jgi:glycosyltransferase involved in cell wall biosynthesis
VPNVVDTDVFVPAAERRPSSVPRLVTVGSLIERKGHRHLIAALARLCERGCHLTLEIIGDGPLRQELKRFADELGVADAITFAGAQPKSVVAAAMRGADAFVLPSLWENLPCSVLEAMSAGLPVVATRVGGVPEVVDRRAGVLVNPGSPDALADGLHQLTTNVGQYDRQRLRERAVAEFGYDAIARRWANLYAAARG